MKLVGLYVTCKFVHKFHWNCIIQTKIEWFIYQKSLVSKPHKLINAFKKRKQFHQNNFVVWFSLKSQNYDEIIEIEMEIAEILAHDQIRVEHYKNEKGFL